MLKSCHSAIFRVLQSFQNEFRALNRNKLWQHQPTAENVWEQGDNYIYKCFFGYCRLTISISGAWRGSNSLGILSAANLGVLYISLCSSMSLESKLSYVAWPTYLGLLVGYWWAWAGSVYQSPETLLLVGKDVLPGIRFEIRICWSWNDSLRWWYMMI